MFVKILVVDDDDGVRELLEEFLQKTGYKVITAGSGEEALNKMKEGPAIVLLDIMMPDMDGLMVLDRIKQMAPSTEVIMVTGLAQQAVGLDSFGRGAFEFVTKPIDFKHLEFLLDFKITQLSLDQEMALNPC